MESVLGSKSWRIHCSRSDSNQTRSCLTTIVFSVDEKKPLCLRMTETNTINNAKISTIRDVHGGLSDEETSFCFFYIIFAIEAN